MYTEQDMARPKTTLAHHGPSVESWFEEEEARTPGWRAEIDTDVACIQLAGRLKALREKSGASQAEVARKAGTQQPHIARMESGKTVPSVELLNKVARALGWRLRIGLEPAAPAAKSKKPRH